MHRKTITAENSATRKIVPKAKKTEPGGILDQIELFPGERAWTERISEQAKVQNISATSKETFELLDFFKNKANSLENKISNIFSNYLLIPKIHVQGFSGFYCIRCNKFGYRPIMDIGFDRTVESKHRCGSEVGYTLLAIPADFGDKQAWMAQVILNSMDYAPSIHRSLYAYDVSEDFTNRQDVKTAKESIGIPDKYSMMYVKKDQLPECMSKAIANPKTGVKMSRRDLVEFLKITKSTYAIVQVEHQDSVRQFFMILE